MIASTQTRNTLVWSAVSAILCGLIGNLFVEWVFWIPGAVFGFLFFIANTHGRLRAALYTLASAAIYIGAVRIFFMAADAKLPTPNVATAGFLAGLFGALSLSIVTKLVNLTSLHWRDEVRTATLGAAMGIAFGLIVFANPEWLPLLLVLAFSVWQVPVGWSLTVGLQWAFGSQPRPPANASS